MIISLWVFPCFHCFITIFQFWAFLGNGNPASGENEVFHQMCPFHLFFVEQRSKLVACLLETTRLIREPRPPIASLFPPPEPGIREWQTDGGESMGERQGSQDNEAHWYAGDRTGCLQRAAENGWRCTEAQWLQSALQMAKTEPQHQDRPRSHRPLKGLWMSRWGSSFFLSFSHNSAIRNNSPPAFAVEI